MEVWCDVLTVKSSISAGLAATQLWHKPQLNSTTARPGMGPRRLGSPCWRFKDVLNPLSWMAPYELLLLSCYVVCKVPLPLPAVINGLFPFVASIRHKRSSQHFTPEGFSQADAPPPGSWQLFWKQWEAFWPLICRQGQQLQQLIWHTLTHTHKLMEAIKYMLKRGCTTTHWRNSATTSSAVSRHLFYSWSHCSAVRLKHNLFLQSHDSSSVHFSAR